MSVDKRKYGILSADAPGNLTLDRIKQEYEKYNTFERDIFVGCEAPDAEVWELDGSKKCLSDYFRAANKPLVLNFGSITWHYFVNSGETFDRVASEFKNSADFLTVYIVEAHPIDGWQIYRDILKKQPKTLEERMALGAEFVQTFNYKAKVVVDSMQNTAVLRYSAFPERLYIIENSKIIYKGGIGPFDYNVEDVVRNLKNKSLLWNFNF